MSYTLVMADGGVGSLLACLAAGLRRVTGTHGIAAAALIPDLPETDPRRTAAIVHAGATGLETQSLRIQNASIAGADGRLIHLLMEAALIVREKGGGHGGEVIWPVAGLEGDLGQVAQVRSRALLVSQMATVAMPDCGPVRVVAPYADLTDRQLTDLVIDMAAPIWMCWWMHPTAGMDRQLAEEAVRERAKWEALLRQAGWTGSLEAKAAAVVVEPKRMRATGV